MDVEWWVEDQLVIEESFNLKAKSSGTLQPQFWKMGQTVRDFPELIFLKFALLVLYRVSHMDWYKIELDMSLKHFEI